MTELDTNSAPSAASTPTTPVTAVTTAAKDKDEKEEERNNLGLEKNPVAGKYCQEVMREFRKVTNVNHYKQVVVDALASRGVIAEDENLFRAKALREMAVIIWNGGPIVQSWVGDSNIIEALRQILISPSEASVVKIATLESLSVIIRNHKQIQSIYGMILMECLSPLLTDENTGVRKWTAHTLLCVLIGSAKNQKLFLQIPNITENSKALLKEDWKGWHHNEAAELLKLIFL